MKDQQQSDRDEETSTKVPKWANFTLIFDCETTRDIRQDLNFLWWRFCELKNDVYVCQQEGVVYADDLDKPVVIVDSAGTDDERIKRLRLIDEKTRKRVMGVTTNQHLKDLFDYEG